MGKLSYQELSARLEKAESELAAARRRQREIAKAARAQAAEQVNRLEAVLAALPVGVCIVDRKGGILQTNAAFGGVWGDPPPSARDVGDYSAYQARWAEDGRPMEPEEWAAAQAVLKGSTVTGQVVEIQRLDGTRAFAHNSAAPIRDSTGRITGAAVAIHDITALREESNFIAAVLDTVGTLVVVLDREGRIERFNRACQQLTGYSAREVQGRIFWEFLVPPEDMAGVRETWDAIQSGDFPNSHENHWLARDGSRSLIAWTNTALSDREGRVLHVIGTGIDITQRRLAEQALAQAKEEAERRAAEAEEGRRLLDALMENIPAGIAITGGPPDFPLKRISRFGQELSQRPTRTVEGIPSGQHQTAWGIFLADGVTRPSEEQMPLYRASRFGEVMRDHEMVIRAADGRRIDVLVDACPIRDAEGRIVGATNCWRDITDRKQMEEALRRSNEELEQRVRERTTALEETVESLRHEAALRERVEAEIKEANEQLKARDAQLRALASGLTLAEQRERRRLARILHDHLQQLLVGAKFRMAILGRAGDEVIRQGAREVEDLLAEAITASRVLTAEISPPILQEAGLNAGLEWLARWMADKHGLFVELTTEEQAPALDEDVKVLLFESVRELLFNAVKHAQVRAAAVSVRRLGRQAQVVVSDQGAGFDPGAVPLAGEKGGGFGLFSIRERLGLIGGRLETDSAPGKGSRFVLTVPLGEPPAVRPEPAAAEPAPPERRAAQGSPPVPGRKIRVLLADDHAVMREGLSRLIAGEPDMEVVGGAADGQEAIELARRLLPDVILMDMNMPKLNGIEATRAIHLELPDITIIGLSMFEEAERAQVMRDAGAVQYVTKTGPADVLIATIRSCIGRKSGK